jgi:pimeloyl-ACP methyl ester carboxylesterase
MLSLPYVPGVQHSFIDVNHAKLHIAEAGKGKPILLLHGWPQHWYVWRKIIPELAKTHRLIMPDLPGLGWSDIPDDKDFRKEALAEDMLQLLVELKLNTVGLVGHDWGGWIGFLMCLKKPQHFSALLAMGIAHPFQYPDKRLLQFWRLSYQIPIAFPGIGEILLQKYPPFIKYLLKKGTRDKSHWNEEELFMYANILQEKHHAYASSLLYRTFITKELPKIMKGDYRMQRLTVPTRLLVGTNDPVIYPELVTGFENYARDMQVTFIKNCGHFIPEEKPEEVINQIRKLFH